MTSSRWISSPPRRLRFCGVDAEKIERFSRLIRAKGHPMPFVFSAQEMYFCRSLQDPRLGLCAAFCCKEAVFKALGRPHDMAQCRFLYRSGQAPQPVQLGAELRNEFGITEACAIVRWGRAGSGELVVAAYLY
jgi:4'-phosphopantetheinyl transferase EntD